MNARRKRAGKRLQPLPDDAAPKDDSPTSAPLQKAANASTNETALDECVGAICLVEVTLHSLESQEVAYPEQEVLRRALRSIWFLHDWIYELKPDATDGDVDREGEL